MDTTEEKAYAQGERSAMISIVIECLKRLGYDEDPEVQRLAWVVEREETIRALRDTCRHFGDNDWPDDLHLADVLEKHLAKHLHANSSLRAGGVT